MVNIGNYIEDFECTEYGTFNEAKENLREQLIERVTDYCNHTGYKFEWVSDNALVLVDIEDGNEDFIENDIIEKLDTVYDIFMEQDINHYLDEECEEYEE